MTPGLSSHFKIGLFVILAGVAVIATAIALQVRSRRPTVAYYTYFDESVQGLDVGSPVLYRGVRIGNVGRIGIAPDTRHVEVTMAIDRATAATLELAHNAPMLRAQLGLTGITGLKFVDIDYAGPKAPSPPRLPFSPPAHYIPSQRSFFGGLQNDLDVLGRDLPIVVERLTTTLDTLDQVLHEVTRERVMKQLSATLADMQHLARHLDRDTAPRLDRTLDQLGDVGRSAARSTGELSQTLRDLGDASRAVRALVSEIEREPDILVKGRGRR